jgi:ribosomal protein S19
MKETDIMKLIMIALSKKGRAFRNNVGSVKTADNRFITFGLCVGSSDIIGWTSVTITPEMVGKEVAVFTAVEVKKTKGKESDAQVNFIERVLEAGGIAGIARSEAEAERIQGMLETGE